MLVDGDLKFKFLISVPDDFSVVQGMATLETHVLTTIAYPDFIVFV